MKGNTEMSHIGRSWVGHWIEDECPCEQESCGLVNFDKINSDCPQHSLIACKTIRQSHDDDNCPAIDEDRIDVEEAAKARQENEWILHKQLMKELDI